MRASGVDVVPVSVVVPTIGRPRLLDVCLASLGAGRTQAAEILVVDQSRDAEVAAVVQRNRSLRARLVDCTGVGVARGRNRGIECAKYETVLVTDDDCTVAPDWVATGWHLMREEATSIITGRVLPAGDPRAVPSTRGDMAPRDHTGEVACGVLYPNNMALNRSLALSIGGFDERFGPREAAEDNDFCYRWLRAGQRLRYEPKLTVWHHEWRTPDELERLYVAYGWGQGFFYAKHLRKGDLTMLRFIARDVYYGLRSLAAAKVRARPQWSDPRRGILSGLPAGLMQGWREYGT